MNVVSIKEHPQYCELAITYFQDKWASPNSMKVYEDSISHSLDSDRCLPQWYLLMNVDEIIGCAGLIPNDFISRMDLYPWLCALYIEPEHRGKNYSALLIEQGKLDAAAGGFSSLYLCTDHVGLYEKFGFEYIGMGYHPWGEDSRIYRIKINE